MTVAKHCNCFVMIVIITGVVSVYSYKLQSIGTDARVLLFWVDCKLRLQMGGILSGGTIIPALINTVLDQPVWKMMMKQKKRTRLTSKCFGGITLPWADQILLMATSRGK